jgi:hypothetical protein
MLSFHTSAFKLVVGKHVVCADHGSAALISWKNQKVLHRTAEFFPFDDVGTSVDASRPKRWVYFNREHDDCCLHLVQHGCNDLQPVAEMNGHCLVVNQVINWNEDQWVSCSEDETVRLFDERIPKCAVMVLRGHSNSVLSVCKLSDNVVASGGSDNKIRIWDLRFQKYAFSCKQFNESVEEIIPVGDDALLARSTDNELLLYNVSKQIDVFRDLNASIRHLFHIVDNRFLCVANGVPSCMMLPSKKPPILEPMVDNASSTCLRIFRCAAGFLLLNNDSLDLMHVKTTQPFPY